jgi:hypothetical protein
LVRLRKLRAPGRHGRSSASTLSLFVWGLIADLVHCARRIPLPEGLAPLSPQSLDESLTKLIEGYTLRGASILVHCRGGLGRAGLVACCWALKVGLCGWINVDLSPDPAEGADGLESHVRRDTLQLTERAIAVMRRRRSVKAVETLKQVQFLTEYVDYLRERVGREGRS